MTYMEAVGWQGLFILAIACAMATVVIRYYAFKQGYKQGFDEGVAARIHYVKKKFKKRT